MCIRDRLVVVPGVIQLALKVGDVAHVATGNGNVSLLACTPGELRGSRMEPDCGGKVASVLSHRAKTCQGAELVREPARDGGARKRRLEMHPGAFHISLVVGETACPIERFGIDLRGVIVTAGERLLQPVTAGGNVTAIRQVVPDCRAEAKREVGVAVRERPFGGGPEIIYVGIEPVGPEVDALVERNGVVELGQLNAPGSVLS